MDWEGKKDSSKRCNACVTALFRRGAETMLSTTLLRSLFKNHLNMRQHQLKLSPVSDSASIPIQEANPKQRKSWLNLWENDLLSFKDQSTCAGKDYQSPLIAIGLQKIIFWPQWVSAGAARNKWLHFAGNKIPSSHPPRQHRSARTVYQENKNALKNISKENYCVL